jgi:dTDP-4-amino-4,6-dideoxygalactose transaminase
MRDARVPFTDLGAMAREVWPAVEHDFTSALLAGRYIGGPEVSGFEEAFAAYCGADHAIGTGNGTDALLLTLEALGVGPGDGVVLPANTFIATAEAVVRAGALPQFADVDPATLLLTPETMRAAMTERTRAVIPVHLFGQPVDMTALCAAAEEAGLLLIEDAAQGHGAEWEGRRAGSFGVAACFSFYPGKNLGAFGDAGAVVTSDPELAERVRSLANHGRPGGAAHYAHDLVGTNSRLDTLQAIALSEKLRRNEEWTEARIAVAAHYRRLLSGSAVRMLDVRPEARHVYHLMVVRVGRRDRVREHLASAGVESGIHYPTPCHQLPPLRRYARSILPASEQAAEEILSLPIYPHMPPELVDRVCDVLLNAVELESGVVLHGATG